MTVLLKNVTWLQNTSLWITLNRTLSTSAATDILNGLSIKVVWMLEPIPAVIEWEAGVQVTSLLQGHGNNTVNIFWFVRESD